MANSIKTVLLLGLLSGLLLAVGGALGGTEGLVGAFLIAMAINFGSYWFSDKIVLRMYRAQPVDAEHPLCHMTTRLARNANLPMPRVYLVEDPSPNAFATGRNPSNGVVVVTTGLMDVLEKEEVEGVIAHELAHIKHRDILISSVAATVAAAIVLLARMAQYAAIFGGRSENKGSNLLELLAMIIVAPLAAMLIQMAISRSREFAADRGAAAITGNPRGLANALKRIEVVQEQVPLDANPATAHMFIMMPLSGRGLRRIFSTHPPTEKRIRALMEMS